MPPNPRPIPRFIADSTQEGIPHGRFAETPGGAVPRGLRRARRAARGSRAPTASSTGSPSAPGAAASGSPAAPGPRGPRARSSSSATSPTSSPIEGDPSDFRAKADFTDVLAEDNDDWKIDLNDDVIGRWRGENGRAGAVTLVWGRPLAPGRRRRHRRARPRDRRPGSDLQRPLHADRPRRPRGLRRRDLHAGQALDATGPKSWPRRASTTERVRSAGADRAEVGERSDRSARCRTAGCRCLRGRPVP